jgi:hypothetical protein
MFLAITAAIICGSSSISSAAVCDTMDVMLVGDTGMWVLILTLNAQHLSEYLTSDIRIFCRRPPRACVA